MMKFNKFNANWAWTTANGKSINIKEMDTTHIKNCINKIKNSGGVWRGEYLEILESELKRRNLNITSEKEVDSITDKEKIYFLETSCESKVIKIDKNKLTNIVLNEKITDYTNNWFVLNNDTTKESFQEQFVKDIKTLSENEFYEKYSKFILDNVFTKEWKNFIDIMLGRTENE